MAYTDNGMAVTPRAIAARARRTASAIVGGPPRQRHRANEGVMWQRRRPPGAGHKLSFANGRFREGDTRGRMSATGGLHGYLLSRGVRTPEGRQSAVDQYKELVSQGSPDGLWQRALRQQIYLGDEAFVDSNQQRIEPARLAAIEIPQEHRRKPLELAKWLALCATRKEPCDGPTRKAA